MNPKLGLLGTFILALPIAVEAPRDSGHSPHDLEVSLGGGIGYYALIRRGCQGEILDRIPVRYGELGGAIDYQLQGPLHLGARVGLVQDRISAGSYPSPGSTQSSVRHNRYVNPYFSLDGRSASIGAGWVLAQQKFLVSDADPARLPVSGHLRLGERGRYVSISLMENVPLYSSGGYFDFGLGFQPARIVDGWVGMSAGGPYDGGGVALKGDVRLAPGRTLDLRVRVGGSAGEFQGGVSLGVTGRFEAGGAAAPR